MKNILLFILVALFSSWNVHAQQSDVQAVRTTFDGYKQALLNRQAEDAIAYLDTRTLKYYDSIAYYVKYADSVQLSHFNLLDQIMVLLIRHRVDAEQLKTYDGYELLLYSINHGMVGDDLAKDNDIGKIIIKGDFAQAALLVNGQSSNMQFNFYKENTSWKMNLTSLFPAVVESLESTLEEVGWTSWEFISYVLESSNGQSPNNRIWHPLILQTTNHN